MRLSSKAGFFFPSFSVVSALVSALAGVILTWTGASFSGAAFTVSAAGALDLIVTMGAGACFPLLDAGVLASIPMTGESAITIDAARMIFFSNAISPFYENPSRV